MTDASRKRLYFGHPINTYGTDLENHLLECISRFFAGWDIENANQKRHSEGYEHWKKMTGNGMDYFTKQVLPSCHGGVFLPFRDGKFGIGVFTEAKFYAERGLPIWAITPDGAIAPMDLSAIQPLTVEETRSRIRTASGETAPY